MQKTAHILGTDHTYQRNDDSCEPDAIKAFLKYLRTLCNAHGIKAIGEEMSVSALNAHDRAESIPAKFASRNKITHRYCDPSPEEQQAMGIVEGPAVRLRMRDQHFSEEQVNQLIWKEDLKREPYWLTKIQEWEKERDIWPLLFICGSCHVISFSQRLTTIAITVHVAHHNWVPKTPLNRTRGKRGASHRA